MDIISAYQQVGTYRGAAEMCGTTHKTVRRVITAHEAGEGSPARASRARNYDLVADLVAERVRATKGKITAKRLLPAARVAGFNGSARNFRRLVADTKAAYRREHGRGRRPAVWSPGEYLLIDWGVQDGLHVFCAVLAWSRVRFVRFATDEKAVTTLRMLAECFEVLGGVPKVVLADRMGCLKGGVVANVVVPTPDYVRFATHYGFRPDFREGHDPESKGMVERLVGYAKTDLMIPQAPFTDLTTANMAAAEWCVEVNQQLHSEIAAVPAERLIAEGELLGPLPGLRLQIGPRPVTRKVDRLSCVRFGSARYSVPHRLIGVTVTLLAGEQRLEIVDPATGEIVADHALAAPGTASVVDEHYPHPRPDRPRRAPRAQTTSETRFLALGEVAEAFLTGAAAAGVTRLGTEIEQINTLTAGHGEQAVVDALRRAVAFRRWRARDIASILDAGSGTPTPRTAGQALIVDLPTVPTRSLDAYRIGGHR